MHLGANLDALFLFAIRKAGIHSHVCRPDKKVVNMVGLEILNKAFALPVVFKFIFFLSVEIEVKPRSFIPLP